MTASVLHGITGRAPNTDPISFILSDNLLVTVRYIDPRRLIRVTENLVAEPDLASDPLSVLVRVLDALVDCGTRTGVSGGARRTGSATGISRTPTRRWRGRRCWRASRRPPRGARRRERRGTRSQDPEDREHFDEDFATL